MPAVFPSTSLKALRNDLRRFAVQTVPKRHRARAQAAYRPLIAAAMRGDRVQCPLCEGTFRNFMAKFSAAGPSRAGARCPRCGSLERHRLLWLFLRDEAMLLGRERQRVLHFAPEPGFEWRLRAAPQVEYLSADLDAPPAMVCYDVTAIPEPDGRFDVVLCNHVLEHVPDDRRAMREIHRVLAEGGWAVLSVPYDSSRATTLEDPDITAPEDRERAYGQWDHVRLYGTDYFDRLAKAGFVVDRRRYAEKLGPEAIRRHGLAAHDEIVLCRRREDPAITG
jgi:SAM-dependent methyltransferase